MGRTVAAHRTKVVTPLGDFAAAFVFILLPELPVSLFAVDPDKSPRYS